MFVNAPAFASNIESNGSFETADLSDWLLFGGSHSVEVPAFDAQEGSYAAKLTAPAGGVVGISQEFDATPGAEFYMSGYMRSETPIGETAGQFGLLKIVFFDAFGADIVPESWSKGFGQLNDDYPGIESLPVVNSSNSEDGWVFTEAQAVAPPGTARVAFYLLDVNLNSSNFANPIWFDDIQMVLIDPPLNGNRGFETADLSDWLLFSGLHSVEVPAFGAQEGSYAAKLTNSGGSGVAIIAQSFNAGPGDEFYMSGYMRSEAVRADGPELGILKISFWDENGSLVPTSISKGVGNDNFPGVESLPRIDENSPVGAWVFSEAQGVAPPRTVRVQFELTNVNFTGAEKPIWFDDIQMALMSDPDMESNGSFETADLSDWLLFGGLHSVEVPDFGAQEGSYAAKLTAPAGGVVGISQEFDATPGAEFYMSGYMRSETPIGETAGQFGLLKIVFFDAFGADIVPESWSKGFGQLNDDYPGIESLPVVNSSNSEDGWVFTEAQAVAPPGTARVAFYLLDVNLNSSNFANPIWFDDINMALLRPDMDADGVANNIDTDPLSASTDFSDGTTYGTITNPGNQVLSIVDEPLAEGVRIIADLTGGSGVAKVSVCGASATLSIRAGNELVVTCGSVILAVEAGPAVTMEIVLDGEPATVSVPPDNEVTFKPEKATLEVTTTSLESVEPVLLSVGGAEVPIEPGATMLNLDIDIQPGSESNCLNINGHGVIPVAILGSESIDVSGVDVDSLAFAGLEVRIRGNNAPSCGLENVNDDEFLDLVCHFEDEASTWTPGNGVATLAGQMLDDTLFTGTDSVCVVP